LNIRHLALKAAACNIEAGLLTCVITQLLRAAISSGSCAVRYT